MNTIVFEADHFEKAPHSMTMREKRDEIVSHYMLNREHYDMQEPPGVMVEALGAGRALIEILRICGVPVVPVEMRRNKLNGTLTISWHIR